jgi:hypothetical protein
MTSASPDCIDWQAIMTAFSPDPQTLLIVVAQTESASPAPFAACLAGA